MERLIVITLAISLNLGLFLWFASILKKSSVRSCIIQNRYLHPNSICYWRTILAFSGYYLYFFTNPYWQPLAIFIFVPAVFLDGVDGMVARSCNLGTKWGEFLDPLCDKLAYLPPLVNFSLKGLMSFPLVMLLVGIEIFGQFFARKILSWLGTSGAANSFGKTKAILCFALVIYCALVDSDPYLVNMCNHILIFCIILSIASVVFKFIPNKFYANILSGLNLTCGLIGITLVYEHHLVWADISIIVGQLFDLFDGRMAEKHGGTKSGPYLDDIADFVSFGLCPAYIIAMNDGRYGWILGILFLASVGFRLWRFTTKDKHRMDLPPGVFNGLPSPAGAMIVLGAVLMFNSNFLIITGILSMLLMVSHIRFAHFGRLIIKKIPRPIFLTSQAVLILALAYIAKTRNVQLFGCLILILSSIYLFIGWKLASDIIKIGHPLKAEDKPG